MAKQLIQETIQRNSSPCFDGLVAGGSEYSGDGDEPDANNSGVGSVGLKKLNSSGKSLDDSIQRFCYSVNLGDDILRITGGNLQFVQVCFV